jgi:hypothetical protein
MERERGAEAGTELVRLKDLLFPFDDGGGPAGDVKDDAVDLGDLVGDASGARSDGRRCAVPAGEGGPGDLRAGLWPAAVAGWLADVSWPGPGLAECHLKLIAAARVARRTAS